MRNRIMRAGQMANLIIERQKRSSSHTQQHARPSQSPTRTRLLMILTCLAAVGIAVAVGPLPISPNGDLVVSSVMMAAAIASRRDYHASEEADVCSRGIRCSNSKSTRLFPFPIPSLQNHQKTAWSRIAAERACSRLKSSRKVRFFM